MKILISAAETSSDAHGAQLLRALKAESGTTVEAFGIGGPQLQAEGLRAVLDARVLLAMGFQEVLGRLPKIFTAAQMLTEAARRERPDIAVVIDYPDFHFLLARRLKKLNIPVIYYIPPKVWAWRRGRIHTLKKFFVQVLSILPFEEEFYRAHGVSVKYVGNPLVDELPLNLSKAEARKILGLGQEELALVVMPGSRPAELKQHLELMLDASLRVAQGLQKHLKILLPIPLTASLQNVRSGFETWIEKSKKNGENPAKHLDVRISQGDAHSCLVAADAGMIKSGTSTLEAGLLGCPHVIIYKPSVLTGWIFSQFIRYSGAVGLVNLVAGGLGQKKEHFLFREILMDEATPEQIAGETISLLVDSERRERIKKALAILKRDVLGKKDGAGHPIEPSRAAALEILRWGHSSGVEQVEAKADSSMLVLIRYFVSAIWSFFSQLARTLNRVGILKSVSLESRVIGVGNIQVGGAGKTPLVAQIAREAQQRGKTVAILLRGYRSVWEVSGGLLLPKSMEQLELKAGEIEYALGEPDTLLCGDEAALLHDLAPDAWIGVGADRLSSYRSIVRCFGKNPDLVILDDGFQNWKIKKDLEIVALTSLRRGEAFFRDKSTSLSNADLLVWTKGEVKPETFGIPWVKVEFRLNSPVSRNQKPLILVTGIGDSHAAQNAVERAGYQIRKHLLFSDHARYSREDAWRIYSKIQSTEVQLAMTGKDWVKWREFGIPKEDVLVFEPGIIFKEGREIWDRILWNS